MASLVGFARGPGIIIVIGAVHRLILFIRFRHAADALLATRGTWLTWQYYPLEVYRKHFWAGLWFLQQTPPLPHLVLKSLLFVFDWPDGVSHALYCLQALISIATSCLLLRILTTVTSSRTAALLLSLWFLLSTDLAVMEYAGFGQLFYESLGMLLVTACCAVLLRPAGANSTSVSPRRAALAGCLAALGAVTRASLSYYAVIPALFIPRRRITFAAFLAPLLLLQAGWDVKNLIVFGGFNWETSSWGGLNAASGFAQVNQLTPLNESVRNSASGTYPAWFVDLSGKLPVPFWGVDEDDLPADVAAFDRAEMARLGAGEATRLNTLGERLLSAQYKRAVARYAIDNPLVFMDKNQFAYHLFWQRIADFGQKVLAPLYVAPVLRNLFSLSSRGLGEDQRTMVRHGAATDFPLPPPEYRPASFWTISLAPLDAASILAVHLLFPLLVCSDAILWLRGRARLLDDGIWLLAANVVYGLVVFNVVDAGENMRFRLAIEPVLIAFTLACAMCVIRAARMVYARFYAAGTGRKAGLSAQ